MCTNNHNTQRYVAIVINDRQSAMGPQRRELIGGIRELLQEEWHLNWLMKSGQVWTREGFLGNVPSGPRHRAREVEVTLRRFTE